MSLLYDPSILLLDKYPRHLKVGYPTTLTFIVNNIHNILETVAIQMIRNQKLLSCKQNMTYFHNCMLPIY